MISNVLMSEWIVKDVASRVQEAEELFIHIAMLFIVRFSCTWLYYWGPIIQYNIAYP